MLQKDFNNQVTNVCFLSLAISNHLQLVACKVHTLQNLLLCNTKLCTYDDPLNF